MTLNILKMLPQSNFSISFTSKAEPRPIALFFCATPLGLVWEDHCTEGDALGYVLKAFQALFQPDRT